MANKEPKYTLTMLIERLYDRQIDSLARAVNANDDDSKNWEQGEAFAYADVRDQVKKLRARGKTRIV